MSRPVNTGRSGTTLQINACGWAVLRCPSCRRSIAGLESSWSLFAGPRFGEPYRISQFPIAARHSIPQTVTLPRSREPEDHGASPPHHRSARRVADVASSDCSLSHPAERPELVKHRGSRPLSTF